MSYDLFAVLETRPKSVLELQNSARQLGYDVEIPDADTIEFDSFSGFLPCKLNEIETGFEIYFYADQSLTEIYETYPSIKSRMVNSSFVIQTVTFSDIQELKCACVILGSSVKEYGGFVFDPQDDSVMPADEVMSWVDHILSQEE